MLCTYATLTVTFSLLAAGLKRIDRHINELQESTDFLYNQHPRTELEDLVALKASTDTLSA